MSVHIFPVSHDQVGNNSNNKSPEKNQTGKERILFIDDETAITEMAPTVLEKLGYTVTGRTNPLDALALFQESSDHFDLIISDMTMPQMSGVKLTDKVREIRPDIPIIICTGHSSLMNEEKAKEIGISAYAMKPITITEISSLIRKVLENIPSVS